MSRSKRKIPICGIACCRRNAQTLFRVQENKSKRRTEKQRVKQGLEDPIYPKHAYQNEWDSPRDGKQWCGYPYNRFYKHKKWYIKLLRK